MAFAYNPDAFNFVPVKFEQYNLSADESRPISRFRAKEELKSYRDEKLFNSKKLLIQPQAPNLAEIALATMAVSTI
jgi:hypothetical protein